MSHPTTSGESEDVTPTRVRLGLRSNWKQFWLLVAVNAFVGATVGLERTIVPLLAEAEFGIASTTAMLSFIATFGGVKAVTNVVAGRLGDRYGRKILLVAGWLFAVPVPFIIVWAPAWGWILLANVLLGINQGLAWSMTVVMKIDLVGPARRGFAMGLNEFAGYLALAVTALATGLIAESFGLRPEPFYVGIAITAVGLGISITLVRDTMEHMRTEAAQAATVRAPKHDSQIGSVRGVNALRGHSALFGVNQAGLVNNLNDGVAWGVFPLLLVGAGLGVREIGMVSFTYPAVWGVLQLWTGGLSDRIGRKGLIAGGMMVQAASLLLVAQMSGLKWWLIGAASLGAGTAMVYPTLLAAVGDMAPPEKRGAAVGVYRLWRDLGYVVGAVIAGAVADWFGLVDAVTVVAFLTLASGLFVMWRLPETAPLVRHTGSRSL